MLFLPQPCKKTGEYFDVVNQSQTNTDENDIKFKLIPTFHSMGVVGIFF